MFDLIPKLLKSPIFFSILFLTIIMLPSVIYKTGESERLAICVSVGIDYKEDAQKDEKIELSLQFLTPQSSNDLEKNYAVTTVSGQNVSDCLNQIESRIGKEVGLSHCQVIVLSESLAMHGPMEYLDSFTRTNNLTTNSLLICSESPRKLLEAQISESAKIAISLSNILDYIAEHVFTEQSNLEKFYAEYFDESSTIFLPFVNVLENKQSGNSDSQQNSSDGGSTGGGGTSSNESSTNASSPNDQSASGGSEENQNSSSAGSINPSNAPTVGSQGPAEQEVNFENEIGVFQNGKLVAKLDKEQSQIFNILYAKKGRLSIQLNDIQTQFADTTDLAVEIEDKSKTIGYSFVNNYPVITIDLTLFCKLAEVNSNIYTLDTISVSNAQITDVIKKALHKEIHSKLSSNINFAKENGIDMFFTAKNFHRLCTKEWAEYKLNLNADYNYMQDVIFLINLKMVEWG